MGSRGTFVTSCKYAYTRLEDRCAHAELLCTRDNDDIDLQVNNRVLQFTAYASSLDFFEQTPEQQSQDHRRCLDVCRVEQGHLDASLSLCSASRF